MPKKLLLSLLCLYGSYAVCVDKSSPSASADLMMEDIISDLCEAVVNIVDATDDGMFSSKSPPSLGSGFIISEDGYIVTNNHVLGEDDSVKAKVVLYDGTELVPKVVGRDSRVDIALLKVSAGKKLKFLTLGDSDQIKVCQRVVAIGNPFGFENTVTSGIISRKSRNISASIRQIGGGDLVDYIQTDAAINNGNSGGPLILASSKNIGQVIGMNTSMFSESEYSAGINFAIPSNTIKSVIKQLKKFGKIKRAWLGISFIPIQQDVLSALKIRKYVNAVMVTKIDAASPASSAGLQQNDIILSINKHDLSNENRANIIVSSLEVGSTIEMSVLRESEVVKLEIKVGYKDSDEAPNHDLYKDLKQMNGVYISKLGMTVIDVSSTVANMLNLPYNQRGVVISDINNTVCNQHDINIGDVIVTINQKAINSTTDLQNLVSDIKLSMEPTVALFIKRGKETFFRVVPMRNLK